MSYVANKPIIHRRVEDYLSSIYSSGAADENIISIEIRHKIRFLPSKFISSSLYHMFVSSEEKLKKLLYDNEKVGTVWIESWLVFPKFCSEYDDSLFILQRRFGGRYLSSACIWIDKYCNLIHTYSMVKKKPLKLNFVINYRLIHVYKAK